MAEEPRPRYEYVSRPGARPEPKREKGPAVWAFVLAAIVGVGFYWSSVRSHHARPPIPEARPAARVSPLGKCRPYAQFAAALKSGADSDERLIADAACLCSLAGGFTVAKLDGGIQPYLALAACPSGTVPRPFEPDAKVWMGQWIEDPGHSACACYAGIRSDRVFDLAHPGPR